MRTRVSVLLGREPLGLEQCLGGVAEVPSLGVCPRDVDLEPGSAFWRETTGVDACRHGQGLARVPDVNRGRYGVQLDVGCRRRC